MKHYFLTESYTTDKGQDITVSYTYINSLGDWYNEPQKSIEIDSIYINDSRNALGLCYRIAPNLLDEIKEYLQQLNY